jgi:Xaa-Pro aminopeptidase
VDGAWLGERRELHAIVHAAERAAIERCTAGTEWRDVHRTAALVLAEGLAGLGLLRGQPDELVDSGAAGLFFPHGVGHPVGLGVRDAGGVLASRRNQPAPYPNLRMDLPLRPGMTMTVEPGLYFVPALLQDPDRRARHRDQVVWDEVDRRLDFGGVRIEDNVVIGDGAPELLTSDIPVLAD